MLLQASSNTRSTKPELDAKKKAELNRQREALLRLLPIEKLFTLPNLPGQIFDDNEPICCPWHPDESPSCKLYTDGPYPAWWCFSEHRRYTALDVVALSMGSGTTRKEVWGRAVELAGGKAALAALKLSDADLQPSRRQSGEPPHYPPHRDVAGLLMRPRLAPEGWLDQRGVTPKYVHDHGLAFGSPEHTAPSWMRSKRGTWCWRGYGIYFPVVDPQGKRVSVRARQTGTIGGGSNREKTKIIVPPGYDVDETVLANALAWSLLLPPLTDAELELLPYFFGPDCPPQRTLKPSVVDVAEGEGDYLVRCELAEPGTAVFGLHSSSWCQAIADKIPDGTLVRICTHSDEPGRRYQRFVISTLKGRCPVKVRHQRLKLVDRWADLEWRRGYKDLDEVELLKEFGRERYQALEWHDPLTEAEIAAEEAATAPADAPAPIPHEYTDLGNAKRLLDRHGMNLRYCAAWDQWLIWDGKRWEPDEDRKIELLAQGTVESIRGEKPRFMPAEAAESPPALSGLAAAKAEVARVAAAKAEAAKAEVERLKATPEGPAALLKAETVAARAAAAAAAAREAADKAAAKGSAGIAESEEAAILAQAEWAHNSQQGAHLREVSRLAQCRVPVRPAQLDADPWLLNTLSGVIDLQTGQLRDAARELMQTKIVGARYLPGVRVEDQCPEWIRYLRAATGGNVAVIDFLRRFAGYAITGSAIEEVLLVLLGPGGSGKGTFVNTIQRLLGGYAKSFPRTLVADRRPDEHPTDLAGLQGIRFAVVSELKRGSHLATDTVKLITSNDVLPARGMHQDFRDQMITHKMLVMSQYMPRVDADDSGIWRRVLAVAFDCPPEKADKGLKAKLEQESDGILAWLIQGCLEWQRYGLNPPPEVLAKTSEVRSREDTVGDFLDERCDVAKGLEVEGSALFDEYARWCDLSRVRAMAKNDFGTALELRGFKGRKSGPTRYRVGLDLKPEPAKPAKPDPMAGLLQTMACLNAPTTPAHSPLPG